MKTPVYLCVLLASALLGADGKTADTKAPEVKGEPTPTHTANYELAERWSATKVGKLVFDTNVTPHWLETSDRFWFAWETTSGRKFFVVDPVRKSKTPVFDNAKMAAMLTEITRTPYDASHLPITTIRFVKNDTAIDFYIDVDKDADINGTQTIVGQQEDTGVQTGQPGDDAQDSGDAAQNDPQQRQQQQGPPPVPTGKKRLYFEYDLATMKLTLPAQFTPEIRKPVWASVSPDQKVVVFARKHNLFMMDAASYALALKKSDDSNIKETQLTTDGVDGFSYNRRMMDANQDDGTNEESQQRRDKTGRVAAVQIFWSKDSTKFALVREDERKVADLWVIHTLANPRPTLETYKYAMPGEVNVPLPHMELFEVASKSRKEINADHFKDETIHIFAAPVTAQEREHQRNEQQWISDTSNKLYFYRMSRDMHKVDVCVADPSTGDVKVLIEERMNSYIEPKPLRLIGNGSELLWWSERDGWGHYYLFDGSGTLKNQVTAGEFVTENIENVDEKTRTMTFVAEGREPNENPYFTHLYSIKLDGTGMKLLDPGDFSHTAAVSDDGRYFVDNSSRVNTAPHAELYDHLGAATMDLETTDISVLMDAGFKMPEPFTVKADDGITDLYGVMYKPFDFSPEKKYPIIAFVYPGPQTESVTQTFTPKQANVALAQLGFIVIEVGNRGGNPHRSKWYHNYGYGNLRDYGLADKKAAIEELARRVFVDRHRSRRNHRTLRRRLYVDRGDAGLSRFLQGGRVGVRQP